MSQTLLLELNEVNFEFVREYVAGGRLPNLGRLINDSLVCQTTSEKNYQDLEPWIQWVTAHTGKPLAEHGVFRLGDIVNYDLPQIWECLEEQGVPVGAVSPMNAKNRLKNACFFIPDPWTRTEITGSEISKKLYRAISQAVNDNAQSRLKLSSIWWLLVAAAVYARPANYLQYLKLVVSAMRKPWAKAVFLDLLLADLFIKLSRSSQPGFASLFLNAGAHIQHHYLFSSEVYVGTQRNPNWYIKANADPVIEIYELYDRIIGQIMKEFPDARVMIATGLHQDPHEQLTYYWRLREHAKFLSKHNVPFVSVEPRMSRDFLLYCEHEEDAITAETILQSSKDRQGVSLFEVDNRGLELFVMLTYPHAISEEFEYTVGDEVVTNFRNDVAFVAIKNGQHNGIGYFIDAGANQGEHDAVFPLHELPDKINVAVIG